MLKFFERSGSCDILLEYPIEPEDNKKLALLFNKEYLSWHISFARIYMIDAQMIHLLYRETIEKQKNIHITTHKYKLNRYLHKLGFQALFISLIKDDVLHVKGIEVVLIGGSADSSPKIMEIVKQTSQKNITLIIVQHVESTGKQLFDAILQNYTHNKVSYAKDAQRIKKGMIYLAPNDKHLKVREGYFELTDETKYNFAKPSISISYDSFSSYYKEKLLVIQECGYANDGVDKLEMIKRNNATLIIQNSDECKAKPMITHALEVGVQDYVLTLNEIINYINFINMKLQSEDWIDYLLEKVLEKYGYDFRRYQRAMLRRRLNVFMLKHEIMHIKDAVNVILFNKSAFKGFFLEVSINVTELFRKPKSFDYTIKLLKKFHKNSHNIKVWSAGCSSGEEVYSMAILLQNLNLLEKSILYATDFNSVILEEAKNAIYSYKSYKIAQENFTQIDIDDNLNYYVIKNLNYVTISDAIREKVLFFQHNLVSDGSFNEFDIIICKNVIIYFDNDLQQKVFQLFYDSLKFGGNLILGESEQIHIQFKSKFKQFSDDCKIFQKVA